VFLLSVWLLDFLLACVCFDHQVLAMHNQTTGPPRSFVPVQAPAIELYGWHSTPSNTTFGQRTYVALFNAEPTPQNVTYLLQDVGFAGASAVCARDLWLHAPTFPDVAAGAVTLAIPGHGTAVVLVTLPGDPACKIGI
jgi:hypothetical protein